MNTSSMFYNNSSLIKHDIINILNNNRLIWVLATFSFSLLVTSAFVFGRHICQSKQIVSKDFTDLQDAISNNKIEMDNQNMEVKIITNAIRECSQGYRVINEQNRKNARILDRELFHAATEKTSLLETSSQQNSRQLLEQLNELMTNYPKGPYSGTPMNRIESYDKDRKDHHAKILSIAVILLPSLEQELRDSRVQISQIRI